jgi:hypothetical protein
VLAQTANGNFLYTRIIKTAKIGQIRANRQQQAKIDTAPTIYAIRQLGQPSLVKEKSQRMGSGHQ